MVSCKLKARWESPKKRITTPINRPHTTMAMTTSMSVKPRDRDESEIFGDIGGDLDGVQGPVSPGHGEVDFADRRKQGAVLGRVCGCDRTPQAEILDHRIGIEGIARRPIYDGVLRDMRAHGFDMLFDHMRSFLHVGIRV